MAERLALVAGAGPAGLTCALELLRRGAARPLVIEPDAQVGCLAKTVEAAGRRMDLGGHRFFSKSDRVLQWWSEMLPFDLSGGEDIGYQSRSRSLAGAGVRRAEPGAAAAFRVRPRRSRILFEGRLYEYPLRPGLDLLRGLGVRRAALFAASFLAAQLSPGAEPRNLEEFFVARFGRRLYESFFKSYTEKVWGRRCDEIGAEWGAQRVKSLNLLRARATLEERFLYPDRGPGQLWEEAARRVAAGGGEIRLGRCVTGLELEGGRVRAARVRDLAAGAEERVPCDLFFSSMPVRDLIAAMGPSVSAPARAAAAALEYRDFLTVGLQVERLRAPGGLLPDTWIYVHDPSVRLGRIQIYDNWSPAMSGGGGGAWLGLEYFCREGDALWTMDDAALGRLAAEELERLGLADASAARFSAVARAPKAYPAYWGGYERFADIRAFVDGIENLYLIGRNGMHRYNNQDHSMLSAMAAVEHCAGAGGGREAIWAVNADDEHHEEGG
jgi:protoporphyrinogen oxidase